MTSPFDLPSRAVAGAAQGLGSLGEAARRAPELQRDLLALLRSMDDRMAALPRDLEKTLGKHFKGQREDIQSLTPELERNRRAAESLPGHLHKGLEGLGERIDGLREEMQGLRAELAEIRAVVEPLQGPAERAAKLSDRLPGNG